MTRKDLAVERGDGTYVRVPADTLDSIRTLTAKGVYLRIVAEADGLSAPTLDTERHPADDPREIAAAIITLMETDLIDAQGTDEGHVVYRATGLEVIDLG